MHRYYWLLLILLGFSSCTRKDCQNGQVFLYFENFSEEDLSLLEVTAYERGSTFTRVDKVFYSGFAIKNNNEDSVRLPVPIDLRRDYQVRVIHTGQVYKIHELFFLQQHIREQWGKKPADCINELAYTINSKKLKRPMKEIRVGGNTNLYIALNKNEPY